MLVSCIEDKFLGVIEYLKDQGMLSVDTETTGTRPYHGDEIFSIIISSLKKTFFQR